VLPRLEASRPPDGYMWPEPGMGRRAVYGAVHPVTHDQLLTPWPLEADDLGYVDCRLLGHVSIGYSLTGTFEPTVTDIPWASHFGRRVRQQAVVTAMSVV
jgi:hypothetical protein